MPACANDLSPIIISVSVIIAVQVPLIIAAIINGMKTRSDAHTLKSVGYETRQKVDELTLITRNGFHGPPGPQGPPGEPSPDIEKQPPSKPKKAKKTPS